MTEYTKYTITENAEGFLLEKVCGESVSPHTQKATAREVVARLMQLMKVGPVAPQTWPEEVCIGFIETGDNGS